MNILWGWDISHFTGDILWHVSISKTFEIWYPISICLYFDSLKLYRNVFVHQTELWVPTWYVCSQRYYRNIKCNFFFFKHSAIISRQKQKIYWGGVKIENRENLGQCPYFSRMSQFQFGNFNKRGGGIYFSKMSQF